MPRFRFFQPRLLIAMGALALGSPHLLAQAVTSTSLSIVGGGATAVTGSVVTLQATVQCVSGKCPATFPGFVTFYDGANILGVRPASLNPAVLATTLLDPGPHSLFARYSGASQPAVTGSVSNTVPLAVLAKRGVGFDQSAGPNTGVGPTAIVTGDFNNDNIPDLAVVNSADSTVSVFLGNGDGTFTAAAGSPFFVGPGPSQIVVADFNRDGNQDLAISTPSDSAGVTNVLFGNGDGTFQQPLSQSGFDAPFLLAAADFNGDGIPDLAYVSGGFSAAAHILIGIGNGLFNAGPDFLPLNVEESFTALAVADVNGDGAPDVLLSSDADLVYVLLNNGDGTFQPPATYAVPQPGPIATGDFNRDGRIDIAVGDRSETGQYSILLNAGNGTFANAQNNPANIGDLAIHVGDFNGDGVLDLAVLFFGGVDTLLGNGDGTFGPPTSNGQFNGGIDFVVAGYNNGQDFVQDFAVLNDDGLSPASVLLLLGFDAPTAVSVTAGDGQQTPINTAFPTRIQVALTDAVGQGVGNATVTVTAPSSGPSGAFTGGLRSVTVTTDAFGFATLPVFTANGIIGPYSLIVAAGDFPNAAVNLANTGPATAIAVVSGTPQSANLGTPYALPLVAKVTDGAGTGISGVTVTFTAPLSGATGVFTGGLSTVSVATDANGLATSPVITANNIAGAFTVAASTRGVSAFANFSLNNVDAAATLTVISGSPQSATAGTQFPQLLRVRVQDSGGAVVPNASVTFTAPPNGPSGTFPGGLTTATVQADANGIATAPAFTANGIAGSYNLSATSGNAKSALFALTNNAASPATVVVVSGSGQTAALASPFALPLQVKVTDTFGNPVSGTSVTFAAPATGASGSFPGGAASVAVKTDAQGLATAPVFTANNIPGTYTVSASLAGLPATAQFTLTNTGSALTLTPAALSFSFTATGPNPPAQTISVGGVNPVTGATASTVSGGNWLSASIAGPNTVAVSVNPAGLAAGAYNGTVTVTTAGGSQTATVSLTVLFPIAVGPPALTFVVTGSIPPPPQTISVTSPAGAVSFTATASSPGNWLSVSLAASASASAAARLDNAVSARTPATLLVSANPSLLGPGNFNGTITISSPFIAGSPITVPVTVSVRATLSTNGGTLSFIAQTGQPAPAPKSVTINATDAVDVSLSPQTNSGGNWLSASTSGSLPGAVRVAVDPSRLAPGVYTGTITIASPNANSLVLNVTLSVVAPLQVGATSLRFSALQGAAPPPPQSVSVSSTGAAVGYSVSTSGESWLSASSATAATPGSVQVAVNPAGLAPGNLHRHCLYLVAWRCAVVPTGGCHVGCKQPRQSGGVPVRYHLQYVAGRPC